MSFVFYLFFVFIILACMNKNQKQRSFKIVGKKKPPEQFGIPYSLDPSFRVFRPHSVHSAYFLFYFIFFSLPYAPLSALVQRSGYSVVVARFCINF